MYPVNTYNIFMAPGSRSESLTHAALTEALLVGKHCVTPLSGPEPAAAWPSRVTVQG